MRKELGTPKCSARAGGEGRRRLTTADYASIHQRRRPFRDLGHVPRKISRSLRRMTIMVVANPVSCPESRRPQSRPLGPICLEALQVGA
jgi:hypothetical protein